MWCKTLEIRPVQTHDEYLAVEQIQREVWGDDDVMVVPNHLLITAQKNGGLLLGAFEALPEAGKEQLVGFVFGFVGLAPSTGSGQAPHGKVKHCSHMAGVLPAYQNQNVGYRLKLAQREHVLAQGLNLITWTFDPLESRNARLNFHKLGATCRTYLRNLYGDMRDELNAGLPSDRFQVDWYIASAHVADRLRGDWVGPSASLRTSHSLSALQAEGVPVLNRPLPGDLPHPPQATFPIAGDRLLVHIPAQFQAIKAADLGLALAWREHTRALFEAAFAAGYTVVDLLSENEQACYLLEKGLS
jgi:predicted GNAT superfamily acetyltransferase